MSTEKFAYKKKVLVSVSSLFIKHCGFFLLDSFMWATVHLSNNQDKFQRALRNTDIKSIQNVFTTVQNQIHVFSKIELYGMAEQWDWIESPCRSHSLLDQEFFF